MYWDLLGPPNVKRSTGRAVGDYPLSKHCLNEGSIHPFCRIASTFFDRPITKTGDSASACELRGESPYIQILAGPRSSRLQCRLSQVKCRILLV